MATAINIEPANTVEDSLRCILWDPICVIKNVGGDILCAFPHLNVEPSYVAVQCLNYCGNDKDVLDQKPEKFTDDSSVEDFCQRLAAELSTRMPVEWKDSNSTDASELINRKEKVKLVLRRYDKFYEKKFGRPPTRAEKEPMREMYECYRTLKAAAVRVKTGQTVEDANREKLEAMQREKNQLGKRLQLFASSFEQTHGRRVKFARDINPVDAEYRRYKKLKMQIAQLQDSLRN